MRYALYGNSNMPGTAQILANRQNAEKSSGPVTIAGKTRVSQNATKFGLFSVANFVHPEERDIFNEFESGYLAELAPDSSLEQTLAREIIHSAWRLRRCADLEVAPPENLTDEELDRLQTSIDRARAAAQRTFHRSLKELRRLQAERLYISYVAGASATKETVETGPENSANKPNPTRSGQPQPPAAPPARANQAKTTFEAVWVRPYPHSWPVPANASGQRCCGKNAPPVLTAPAAVRRGVVRT